jgi:GEVED domain/Secretion system C-terminal sorting domain/Fibronectin type III domain
MNLKFTLLLTLLGFVIQQTPLLAQCNAFTYCTSSGGTPDEWIGSFELGSINNVSGNNSGYANFTNLSTVITLGQTYNLTCTPEYDDFTYTEVFQVFIDYNSDGDFDDADELIFDSGGVTAAVTGSFTVPVTAIPVTTALRVVMRFAAANGPCGTFTFGEVEDYCVTIDGGNGCFTAPMVINDITDSGATANWFDVPTAESYNFRYREVGGSLWIETNLNGNSFAMDLEGCTVYEAQVETLCPNGLSSGYGPSVEFLTFGCGNCLDLTYCVNTNPFVESYIETVSLNTLNNTSGNNNGIADFTGPVVTSLEQGITYDITTTQGFQGFNFGVWYTAYIDFNADGDFNDPFEKIMDSNEQLVDLSYTSNFPVPPTAVVGTTRLRVFVQNFAGIAADPCASFFNGEVEDYCVEITEGTGCYLPLETAVIDNLGESIVIGWETGLSVESFSIRYRTIGAPTWTTITNIPGIAIIYEIMDLEECTDYEFQLMSLCGGTSSPWSNSYPFKTFGCGACFDFTYCEAMANNSNDDNIETVIFGDLNNTSGSNGGYINFEDQFGVTYFIDSTYNMVLTPNWPGFMFQVAWRVWIDYNADGDFEDPNEMVFEAPASTNVQMTTITIPSDAVFGLTKMRISMSEGFMSTPCQSFTFGEVEDYCITISPIVFPCLVPENLDVMSATGNSADLVWEPDQYETAIGYIVRYKLVDETEWEQEVSTNDPNYPLFGLEFCKDYEYQVRSVCPQDISEYTESFEFNTCLTGTEEEVLSQSISALNVYPNPFTDRIQLDFELQKASNISVQLFNLNGQLVQALQSDNLSSGAQRIELVANDLSAGMYLIQLATEEDVIIRKLVKN